MGFFKLGKRDKILDLTEKYKKQERENSSVNETQDNSSQELPSQGALGFLGNFSQNSSQSEDSEISDEKKRRLAKRLMDLTSKMEDLSNQIYHLQQRVELLERKMK